MATFAKVRALPSAFVLTFVVALSLAGAGAAHAAPRTTKPVPLNPCVWITESSYIVQLWDSSENYTSPVGFYEAAFQKYSCNIEQHRGVGEFYFYPGAGSRCDPVYINNVELVHNHTDVNHSGTLDDIAGDTQYGCPNGNLASIVTGTYTNSDDGLYCAEMTGTVGWGGHGFYVDLATGYDAVNPVGANGYCA